MNDNLNLVKFRFTFEEGNCDDDIVKEVIAKYMAFTEPVYMTSGFEKLNKLGEPAKPHIHIHIATEKNIAAIRRAFQRHDMYKERSIKGNELYSLAEEKDVNDYCRFFRYVYKQGGRVKFREILPPDFDLHIEEKCAKEEYASMVKFNQAKRDKALAPTNCDKLMEYLESLEEKLITDVDILEKMIQYYADRGSAANRQTLLGYLNTYKIRNGIMTSRQMAELWLV